MRPRPLPLRPVTVLPKVGAEHELSLWQGADRVDFRSLIGAVAGHLRSLDPGDPRARRLPSGVALTADGWEAELASPPLALDSLGPIAVDRLLRQERTALREAVLEEGVTRVTGFSTHLNISVPDDRVVPLAEVFVADCLVALAAVTEPASSAGVFVRPRRGRLEVGGEYAEGPPLVAGLTLLAGCVLGLLAGTRPPTSHHPHTEPSREKFGWFVPPSHLADVSRLATVWAWAAPWAASAGLSTDPVDALLDGRCALRRNGNQPTETCTFLDTVPEGDFPDTAQRTLATGVRAETEWLTWAYAVWRLVDGAGRECRAVVPADREPEFLEALDTGRLDLPIRRMLHRPRPRRRLLVHDQVGRGGLWHDVRPGALVPAERSADGRVPRVSARSVRRTSGAAR